MAEGPLVLFGAGRMGSALAEGWLGGEMTRPLAIVEPKPSPQLEAWHGNRSIQLNPKSVPASVLAICVKPQVFADVVDALREWVGPDTLVLSIMAGIKLDQIAERLRAARVIRAMPNTPGAIGKGVTLISPGAGASEADIDEASSLLRPLGLVEGPMAEAELTVATAISGCGPAYSFLLAEVLTEAGIAEGLDPAVAERIARATVTGSAALLAASKETPEALRRAVTSPNGVTQAALEVLMREAAWPSLMKEAVRAAIDRDEALAKALEGGSDDGRD